jgi:hypothetical protein
MSFLSAFFAAPPPKSLRVKRAAFIPAAVPNPGPSSTVPAAAPARAALDGYTVGFCTVPDKISGVLTIAEVPFKATSI